MSDDTTKGAPGEGAPRTGAVAMIDALGFEGIYREHGLEKVTRALRAASETLGSIDTAVRAAGMPGLRFACFSDTAIMAIPAAPEDFEQATAWLARGLMAFLHRAMTDPHRIPLVYRGCLTVGDFYAEGQFFVGPAVDESARWFEEGDAAIVWLTPKAAKLVKKEDMSLVPMFVDIKGHGPLSTFAVNVVPPSWTKDENDVERVTLAEVQTCFSRPFDRADPMPADVAIKKQRTLAFLAAAHAHSQKWSPNGVKSV